MEKRRGIFRRGEDMHVKEKGSFQRKRRGSWNAPACLFYNNGCNRHDAIYIVKQSINDQGDGLMWVTEKSPQKKENIQKNL